MTNPIPIPSAVDLQGFESLRQRAANDDPKAIGEAAVQFEALFIGMMLKSARDATHGGAFDGFESRQYLDLMDQQVALDVAKHGGVGFGAALVKQLTPPTEAATTPADKVARVLELATHAAPQVPVASTDDVAGTADATYGFADPDGFEYPAPPPPPAPTPANGAVAVAATATDSPTAARTPEEFVARLWPEAAEAARALGVEPRLLLAQAALETGWGGSGPLHADGKPANNLFGIKAGNVWNGSRVTQWTIEHSDGVAERKRENFRAYSSTADSFADYVDLISSTPRYSDALERAADPEAYARSVSAAGYATDPDYAEKWLSIYHGDRLDGAIRGLKPESLEPTQ